MFGTTQSAIRAPPGHLNNGRDLIGEKVKNSRSIGMAPPSAG
jgi:hypothetical protein